MRRSKYKKHSVIDGWSLIEPLGTGGNAEVWKASKGGSDPIALKLLYTNKIASEPYARFRDEIRILQTLKSELGVLPILDAFVPEKPESKMAAWIAMPIAKPLRKVIASPPDLQEVLDVICHVSATLARLAEDEVFHRDIKPDNLLRFENRWVIGDFGLAAFPDKAGVTRDFKKLGPTFFVADEMLNNAKDALPGPADVFSLAKTLWVLSTGQNYPLQGTIEAGNRQTSISSFDANEQGPFLDLLVERCTQRLPSDRPTMPEFATEISAIRGRPESTARKPNIDHEARRLNHQIQKLQKAAERSVRLRQTHAKYVLLARDRLSKIEELIEEHLSVNAYVGEENHLGTVLKSSADIPDLDTKLHQATSVNVLVEKRAGHENLIVSGLYFETFENSKVRITAGHATRFRADRLFWTSFRVGQIDSAETLNVIDDLILELTDALPIALQRLSAHINEYS